MNTSLYHRGPRYKFKQRGPNIFPPKRAPPRHLDRVFQWSGRIDQNADKCHILTAGKLEDTKHTHRYKILSNELEHLFNKKDLGVVSTLRQK